MIYTRKPTQVHAAKWQGHNRDELAALYGDPKEVHVTTSTGSLILVPFDGPAVLVHPNEWLTVDEHGYFRTYTGEKFRQEFEV